MTFTKVGRQTVTLSRQGIAVSSHIRKLCCQFKLCLFRLCKAFQSHRMTCFKVIEFRRQLFPMGGAVFQGICLRGKLFFMLMQRVSLLFRLDLGLGLGLDLGLDLGQGLLQTAFQLGGFVFGLLYQTFKPLAFQGSPVADHQKRCEIRIVVCLLACLVSRADKGLGDRCGIVTVSIVLRGATGKNDAVKPAQVFRIDQGPQDRKFRARGVDHQQVAGIFKRRQRGDQ